MADMVYEAGSAVKFADEHGVSHSHVSAIIRGDANPGNELLKIMGLKPVVVEKGQQPKYEYYAN